MMDDQKMTSEKMLEIFGQDTCDGCDAEEVTLYSHTGSFLCQACCEEQADEDGLEELMNGY
jgi:hypothetical protein